MFKWELRFHLPCQSAVQCRGNEFCDTICSIMRIYLGFIFLLLVFVNCKNDSSTPPPPTGDKFTLSISGTFTVGKELLSVDKITVLLDNNALTSASCGAVSGCINLT